jgi:hypothetical protein
MGHDDGYAPEGDGAMDGRLWASAVLNGAITLAQAAEAAATFPDLQLHHVHAWQNGPGQRLFTGHVALAANLDGLAIEALLAGIEAHLHQRWEVTHVTLERKVVGCEQPALLGRWPGAARVESEDLRPH